MSAIIMMLVVFMLMLGGVVSDITLHRHIQDEHWLKIRTRLLYPQNFVNVRINSHNEKELRIAFGKILAMETFLPSGIRAEYDMTLHQLTNGQHILQAVYQGDSLKQCQYSKDTNQMLDFVSSFMSHDYHDNDFGDVFLANYFTNFTQTNLTVAHLSFKSGDSLRELSEIVNIQALRKQCRNFLQIATTVVENQMKNGKITDIYAEILDNTDPDKLADFNKVPMSGNVDVGVTPNQHDVIKRSTRERRDIQSTFDFNSVLIFPGTKWCGKGDLAACYDDLGEDEELDMCCRDHDCCPYIIPPFSSRYSVFNYRFHSLLHCHCDHRFRGCLRQSVSSMANMIGKIYFNILGSKCFEFEEREVCIERSWWGRCLLYEKQTIASVKSQVSFIDENGHEDYIVVDNNSSK